MNKVVIMRSIPGAGKTTLAKKLAAKVDGSAIVSTDNFWMVDGEYKFDFNFLSGAHMWNKGVFYRELFLNSPLIIVDNTNIESWQVLPYVEAAFKHDYVVELVEPKTKWKFDIEECAKRNTHGVPQSTIEKMLAKWEPTKDVLKKIEKLKS